MDEQMPFVDPELYPDLVVSGGLASALSEVARRNSIDLGEIVVPAGQARFSSVDLASTRGGVGISLAATSRGFRIGISSEAHNWASGRTDDLLAAARVAEAWRQGVTLEQLKAQFPFMDYSALAQALEGGNAVEFRWSELLADDELDIIRPVLVAARADETLRKLWPSVSHLTHARFDVDYVDRAAGHVSIKKLDGGVYQVASMWSEDYREADNVAAAVQMAAALIPRRRPER